MISIEEWIENYYDRRSSSMPDSSITVEYVPKQKDIPPPPGSAEIRMPGRRLPLRAMLYGGTAAISVLLFVGLMLT